MYLSLAYSISHSVKALFLSDKYRIWTQLEEFELRVGANLGYKFSRMLNIGPSVLKQDYLQYRDFCFCPIPVSRPRQVNRP